MHELSTFSKSLRILCALKILIYFLRERFKQFNALETSGARKCNVLMLVNSCLSFFFVDEVRFLVRTFPEHVQNMTRGSTGAKLCYCLIALYATHVRALFLRTSVRSGRMKTGDSSLRKEENGTVASTPLNIQVSSTQKL